MIDNAFFARLDSMSLQLKRHVFGKYKGEQRTVYAGDGLTFKDFAHYAMGDDFRRIDWRVFARTHELFVRRFEEDRNLTVHILLDASGSMAYGDKDSKFTYAAQMALGMAYIAQKHYGRIAFSMFSHRIHPLKVENQNMNFQHMIKQLNATKAHGETHFDDMMRNYKSHVRTKSLIFVFSDFLYPIESLSQLISQYRRSQLFLVQVLHKDEVQVPLLGEVKFVDPEHENVTVKTYVSPRTREQYNQALREHTQAIEDACKGHHAQFLQLDTGMTPIEGFVKLWNTVS